VVVEDLLHLRRLADQELLAAVRRLGGRVAKPNGQRGGKVFAIDLEE